MAETHKDDDYKPLFGTPIASWHTWFAWRPVETVDRGWVWLRRVKRRRIQAHHWMPDSGRPWWQYAVETRF